MYIFSHVGEEAVPKVIFRSLGLVGLSAGHVFVYFDIKIYSL